MLLLDVFFNITNVEEIIPAVETFFFVLGQTNQLEKT